MKDKWQRMGKTMTGLYTWIKQRKFSKHYFSLVQRQFKRAVICFPPCFSEVSFTLTLWRMLYSWKREQGELTARSSSDLGLEMHYMVGLFDGVLLKYFSSSGFIKSITPEIHYLFFFFTTKSLCLSTTAGLI